MGTSSANLSRALWALLFAVAALVYGQSLGAPFFYDDLSHILDNPKMHGLSDLRALMGENLFPQRAFMNLLWGAAWSAGDGATWPFHLLNVALHLLNGVLLERFLRRGALGLGSQARLATVALFLLHPLQAQAVCYIKGLVDLLETMFYLLAFNLSSSRRPRPALLALTMALAPWARETAVLIPLVLWWYSSQVRAEERAGASRAIILAGVVAVASALPVLWLGSRSHAGAVGFSIYPPLLYIFNQLRGVLLYSRLLFDFGAESVVHDVKNWGTGLVVSGTLGALMLALSALLALRLRKRQPVAGFFLFFALVIYGSKCGPLQFINGFAEYRLYLLNLPVFCLIGLGIDRIWPKLRLRGAVAIAAGLALFMVYSNFRYQQLWNDPEQLVEHSLENEPDSRVLRQFRGSYLEQRGKFEEAETAFLEAAELNRTEPVRTLMPQALLMQLYARAGKWEKLEQVLKTMRSSSFASGKPPLHFYHYYLEALRHTGDKQEYEKLRKEAAEAYPNERF